MDTAHEKPVYLYSTAGAISQQRTGIFNRGWLMDARVRRPVHPMPEMAVFIAELRSAFGDKAIDDAVSRGKSGEPAFYACENGNALGTASPVNDNVWRVNADIRDRHYCPGCDGGCVGQGVGCKEWLQRKAGKEKA